MTEIALLHQRLLDDLAASGTLSEPWHGAFAALSRHQFIPDTMWDDSAGELVLLRRADDPNRWLDAAYALDAVITQMGDGHPTGPGGCGRYITSSASRPDVVALMLAALDAHCLGAQNVTSVEIDPALAEHARSALAATGYPVTVITGDGAQGYLPTPPMTGSSRPPRCTTCPTPGWHRPEPAGRSSPPEPTTTITALSSA